MWIRLMLLPLLCLPAAGFADDNRVIKLEQDMRNLERQVGELKRQVDVLDRRGSLTGAPASLRSPASDNSDAASTDTAPWYSSANWDRVKLGMNELEVIRLLGKPNTMRAEDADTRTLLYALEIGSSGFLSGSVELKNHQVVGVNRPVLK
jgi:hypothetical protein